MPSTEGRPYALEQVTTVAYNLFLTKLCSGVDYGVAANIYKPTNIAAMELSSPQCLLLSLLNSLVAGDVMSCLLLANICQQVQQLRSKYLKVWLTEDFVFPRQDIVKAVALFNELLATGAMKLPSHVMGIMSSLAIKYGITCTSSLSELQECGSTLAIEMENAVSNNSPGDIITLATVGGNVNGLTQSGDSLLHLAARTGNCAAIAALGFLKADMEIANSTIATPLELAVRSNNAQSVRALLMAGAKLDKYLLRGDTYLHIAAAGGHNEALSALLEGLQTNVKNHLGETPLLQAVKAGNVRGVEILLDRGGDVRTVPEGSKNLIEIVLESQNVGMFKVFAKGGTLSAFQSKDGDSILHLVASSGNAGIFNILKDQRLSVNIKNKNGVTPLHVASNISIIRMLLGMGSFIDEKDNNGRTALMIAVEDSKPDITSFLLHNGANPNVKDNVGKAVLHCAAVGGHVDLVAALLEAGARVEEKDNEGKTPAFIAAVNNKLNVLELLIEQGADLTLKDSNGEGMIHHAARSGYSDIVSSLLSAGVTVDMKGIGDRTPLHYAAEKGHVPVVSVLLNRGADVRAMTKIITKQSDSTFVPLSSNRICYFGRVPEFCSTTHPGEFNLAAPSIFGRSSHVFSHPSVPVADSSETVDGWTPLIAASKFGSLDVVKVLLDEGAPINDRDIIKKWTALGWAVNNKHTSVADYLRSQGGTL